MSYEVVSTDDTNELFLSYLDASLGDINECARVFMDMLGAKDLDDTSEKLTTDVGDLMECIAADNTALWTYLAATLCVNLGVTVVHMLDKALVATDAEDFMNGGGK